MATNSPQFSQQTQTGQQRSSEAIPLDFRAPPPSPVGASRRASSVANDDILSDFLQHSLRVPDLVLPGRIFPRQNPIADEDVPVLDFRAPGLYGDATCLKIKGALADIGCFQVINHGISPEVIGPVVGGARRVFQLGSDKKRMAVRLPEIPLGFEEVSGDGGDQEEVMGEMSEDFVWGRNYGFKLKMEGIWPTGYSNFSEKMEILAVAIEKIAKEIMLILHESAPNISNGKGQQLSDCICHIYKHPHDVPIDQCISSLRYDIIRMMISGSDYSHALSLHICDGSSEFHVYSKKGWICFTPLENALVVTAGDQIQAWSGGRYKHVIGRPIYTSKDEDCISMAFLYTPPPPITRTNSLDFHQGKTEKIISLREQALFAIFFTIACQFLLLIFNKF